MSDPNAEDIQEPTYNTDPIYGNGVFTLPDLTPGQAMKVVYTVEHTSISDSAGFALMTWDAAQVVKESLRLQGKPTYQIVTHGYPEWIGYWRVLITCRMLPPAYPAVIENLRPVWVCPLTAEVLERLLDKGETLHTRACQARHALEVLDLRFPTPNTHSPISGALKFLLELGFDEHPEPVSMSPAHRMKNDARQ